VWYYIEEYCNGNNIRTNSQPEPSSPEVEKQSQLLLQRSPSFTNVYNSHSLGIKFIVVKVKRENLKAKYLYLLYYI
jgi:hypothetical protein